MGWSCASVIALDVLRRLSASLRPGLDHDLVNGIVCEVLALAVVAYGVARVHLPLRPPGDTFALRATAPLLYPIAAVAGFALLVAASWLTGLLEIAMPMSAEESSEIAAALTVHGRAHAVAFAATTAVLGPLSEELLFRGALFRALRRGRSAFVTVTATALGFALMHLSPHAVPYALGGGLALGVLREVSGSLGPSLTAHVVFNAVSTYGVLAGGADEERVPTGVGIAGTVGCVVCLFAAGWLGRRGRLATEARARDLT